MYELRKRKQDMTSHPTPQYHKSADGWFQFLLFIVIHPPTFLGDIFLYWAVTFVAHHYKSCYQSCLEILSHDRRWYVLHHYLERYLRTSGIESQLLTDDLCVLGAPSVVADRSPLSIDADLNATLGLVLPTHQTNVSRLTFKTRVGHCTWSWGACAYYII